MRIPLATRKETVRSGAGCQSPAGGVRVSQAAGAATRSEGVTIKRIRWLAIWVFAVLCLPSAASSRAVPAITSVSPSSAGASGRIVVLGSGFGSTSDQGARRLLIDGHNAIVTQWRPTEIHAYVPESAAIGRARVRVVTEQGSSRAAFLSVKAPRQDGRIRWRFRTDRWMNRQFVEVGPDGRVYTSDQLGLYALSPAGELLWFVPQAGGGHPIDIGPDGTIYTGVGDSQGPEIVKALNPDGSLKWEFVPPEPWSLGTGPNVGPDGNIYGTQDFTEKGGLGFFSLDPQGNLRWANVGDPPILALLEGDSNSEVVFAPDRMYTGIVRHRSGGNPVTYAFDLQGNQIFQTGAGGLNVPFLSFPRVDPRQRAIGAYGQTGVIAVQPGGAVDWIRFHPGAPNVVRIPAIDSQGKIFAGDWIGVELWALTPDGATIWVQPRQNATALHNVGVSPDDRTLVVSGSAGLDGAGWVRGYSAANGALLWEVPLEPENGIVQHSNNLYPVFSSESRTAYVTTRFANVLERNFGYLYALNITAPTVRPSRANE
jgi:outer membrane protein assembly factor BamB